MNIESLWEQTCALLAKEMNYISYSTWIDGNTIPVLLRDDTLYIRVKMEGMISSIQKSHLKLIENYEDTGDSHKTGGK